MKLHSLSDSVSVVVLEWLCGVGDHVTEGSPLLAVETDKVDAEVPSPVDGLILELLVAAGDEVSTGTPICIVETTFERSGEEM